MRSSVARPPRSAGRGQRGAAVVEVAFVVPLLVFLFLGIAELGLTVSDTQSVVGASQAGVRVASSAGDDRLADHDALMSVAASLSDLDPGRILSVVVFKPEADGSMPAGCSTASQTDLCNRYTAADLSSTPADFVDATSCALTAPDRFWCPLDREMSQVAGTDWIGVRVEVSRTSLAPFIPDRVLSDTTVMRIEPRFVS